MKPGALIQITSQITSQITLCLFLLSGCAAIPEQTDPRVAQVDPFERANRATSRFNDAFDENLMQPVARGYVKVVPGFVRTGVGNFFGNIGDVWTAANTFLQGDFNGGMSDVMRVVINSTFGLLGVMDIATDAGLPKHDTDFGQTLGVWGVPNGPYFVIPFLGPSVIRDTAALPVDLYGDLWTYYRPVSDRNIGTVVRLVDKRATYLDSYSLLEAAALDKYAFIRDAYLQRIDSQIDMRKNAKKERQEELQEQKDQGLKKEVPPAGKPGDVSSPNVWQN